MEQKIRALKVSSKVIAVMAKIGYITLIVVLGIVTSVLLFMAVTGGKASVLTLGGTNIIAFDDLAVTLPELASLCVTVIVMGGILLAILVLTYRMFHQISLTGKPFENKYAVTVRIIGILIAAMPVAVGLAKWMAVALGAAETPERCSDLGGIAVGAIVFCLSYMIEYGCGLENKEAA